MPPAVSLDGADWQVRAFLGVEAAEVAARRGWDDAPGWLPASVPGTVLHDLWRAGAVPDPFVERNSLLVEWVPERTWLYRRRIPAEALAAIRDGERAWLRLDGLDHAGQVYLDGERIGGHEGMFVPFELEVGARLRDEGDHTLAVIVEPAPVTEPQTGRTSRVRVHKSRMTYGWDFCPRMIHQGIWGTMRIERAGAARVTDVWPRVELSDDLRRATVLIEVALDLAAAGRVALSARLDDPALDVADALDLPAGTSVVTLELVVPDPPLWWPNGCGPSPVRRLEVTATGDDALPSERSVPVGFGRFELAENDGAPDGARPYTLVVNGRRLYAKGWNWVPHDVFHGVPRPDRIEHLVGLAARANVNLFRVWGGGLIETEAFYDACDRHGILVWQEFIQSSSGVEDTPSADPDWVDRMRREAESIVPLRRNHPSLAIWCGGNELQDEAGPLDDERSPVLAALREVVARLDPGRAWLPTSPTGPVFHNRLDLLESRPDDLHDVHGPWEHQGLAGQYRLANAGTGLLNSEFGVEGMTNRRAHEALIAPEHRWPADRTNAVYRHLGDWWVNEPHVQACFGGRLGDLETLRRASQHLQADGLRYAIEANRRRWPRNSGSIPWQFNEPYPFAYSTCSVDHAGDPKAAWYAVRRAYAPLAVTAAFERAALDGARNVEAAIFVWSEHEPIDGGRIEARWTGLDGTRLADAAWEAPPGSATAGGRPVRLGTIAASFDDGPPDVLLLDLRLVDAAGTVRATNRYTVSSTADLAPLLDLPAATVEVACAPAGDRWGVRLRHTAGPAALGLVLTDDRPHGTSGWANIEDGWFDLLPGEERAIAVDWEGAPDEPRRLVLGGWNVGPIDVR